MTPCALALWHQCSQRPRMALLLWPHPLRFGVEGVNLHLLDLDLDITLDLRLFCLRVHQISLCLGFPALAATIIGSSCGGRGSVPAASSAFSSSAILKWDDSLNGRPAASTFGLTDPFPGAGMLATMMSLATCITVGSIEPISNH